MSTLDHTINLVKTSAKENFVPIVRDKTLEYLLGACKNIDAKSVLEIGTATGYSGLNMLTIPSLKLTTIEKDDSRFDEAKENFSKAKVDDRVCQLHGDAGTILAELSDAGKRFDLVFLDGPKGQYLKYLPYIKGLLNNSGILFADNILLGGLLKDDSLVNHKNRTMTRNMKSFLTELQNDNDFATEIYEIEDGFSISRKI